MLGKAVKAEEIPGSVFEPHRIAHHHLRNDFIRPALLAGAIGSLRMRQGGAQHEEGKQE